MARDADRERGFFPGLFVVIDRGEGRQDVRFYFRGLSSLCFVVVSSPFVPFVRGSVNHRSPARRK